jgi:hypothetical protein
MNGRRSWVVLVLTMALFLPSTLYAQVLGPFTMQLAPFCNVITFTVVAQGPIFNVAGFDDNCGAATRLSAAGSVFPNPNGTVGGGLSIIGVGQVVGQVALMINAGGPSGTWTDNTGNAGTLIFGVGAGSGVRRPIGAVGAGGCPPDSVRSGQGCMDKYEASVWEVPPGNVALIQKIKAGTATLAELQAGASLRGAAGDDYGEGCTNLDSCRGPAILVEQTA